MSISKYFSFFLTAATLFAGAAQAGNLTLTIGEESRLRDCGGFVQITKSPQGNRGEQVNLVFRGVENCSNFDILGNNGEAINYPNKKLGGADRNRSGSFTLPKFVLDRGWNNVKVVVRSNSGATADTIRVLFVTTPPAPTYGNVWTYDHLTLTIGNEAYLPSCKGRVRVTKSPQGNNGEQINLVFTGVESCSNFVIQSSNYSQTYYEKKIPGQSGNYAGSFTLPKSVIDYGWNNIRIVVQSNSGKHADSITVVFAQGPGNSKQPLPNPPTSGGGSY